MLAPSTVHTDISSAAAVYADTCSFTLAALSPNKNLWDAIPRDIDSLRFASKELLTQYCEELVQNAHAFAQSIRQLHTRRQLIVLDQIKLEVQGQRGRTHGLALRAKDRFAHAPTELVQQSLAHQMSAHEIGLLAPHPILERRIIDDIMRRLGVFWREYEARTREKGASTTDRLLFAHAAAHAIMLENGDSGYGTVALVSRDFSHVFRMYRAREEILRPVCRKGKLLLPRNFIFRPTFQDIRPATVGSRVGMAPSRLEICFEKPLLARR